MAHSAWGLLSIRVLLTYYIFRVKLLLLTDNCFSVAMRLNYTVDTPTRVTWKKIFQSQHFLKTKDSQVLFCKQINVIQGFNYAPIENLKTAWTYLTSQETALKFMNVIGPFAKNLRIFCFQKMLWLDDIVFQVSWFGCLHCNVWKISLKQSYLIF